MAANTDPSLRESRTRSILKGVTWRILASITTMVVALGVTGKVDTALKIGGVEVFAKILIYYFHERAWARVPLGTVRRVFGESELAPNEVAADNTQASRPQSPS